MRTKNNNILLKYDEQIVNSTTYSDFFLGKIAYFDIFNILPFSVKIIAAEKSVRKSVYFLCQSHRIYTEKIGIEKISKKERERENANSYKR